MTTYISMEIILTDASFKKEVLESKIPVLVDFWAEWCGPCKMMGPILEEVAKEFEGKIKIAKMNVDENQVTPGQYNVLSIPTMIYVVDGQVVDQTVGALSKSALVEKLNKVLGA